MSTPTLSRETVGYVLFLAINLLALGIAAWTVSSSDWGYELDGFALVLAPLLGVCLLVLGIQSLVLFTRLDGPGGGNELATSADDTEPLQQSDRDGPSQCGGNQHGKTDDCAATDQSAVQYSGDPLPRQHENPDNSTVDNNHGSTAAESSTTESAGQSTDDDTIDPNLLDIEETDHTHDPEPGPDDENNEDEVDEDDVDEETLTDRLIRLHHRRKPY